MSNNDWSDLTHVNKAYYGSQQSESTQGSDIVEPAEGNYSVDAESLRLKRNSKNQPMLVVRLRFIEGEYLGSCCFFNQVLYAGDQYDGWRMHTALEFLRGMELCDRNEIQFESFPALEKLLDSLQGIINHNNYGFNLSVRQNKRGYNVYKIDGKFIQQNGRNTSNGGQQQFAQPQYQQSAGQAAYGAQGGQQQYPQQVYAQPQPGMAQPAAQYAQPQYQPAYNPQYQAQAQTGVQAVNQALNNALAQNQALQAQYAAALAQTQQQIAQPQQVAQQVAQPVQTVAQSTQPQQAQVSSVEPVQNQVNNDVPF